MDLILAVQPDSAQADLLRNALSRRVNAEVVVVETIEAALSLLDRCVPDVILLDPLIPARDESYLIAYLRALANTDHVQVIGIPRLGSPPDFERPRPSLLRALTSKTPRIATLPCEPQLFSTDVIDYLTRARDYKQERPYRKIGGESLGSSDRRGGHRWSGLEVPWVSSVELTSMERVQLINVSMGGALIRTGRRPGLGALTRVDMNSHDRSSLTFHLASGADIHATGWVVRCLVGSPGNERNLYDVAFQFDQPVGLVFPLAMSEPTDAADMPPTAAGLDPAAPSCHLQKFLGHSATSQNELLACLRSSALPGSLQDTVSRLTSVNEALIATKAMLRLARRTRVSDAKLLEDVERFTQRLRELHTLRRAVVASLSQDDAALILGEVGRLPSSTSLCSPAED
jgi:CheY-like chemotaxis protein